MGRPVYFSGVILLSFVRCFPGSDRRGRGVEIISCFKMERRNSYPTSPYHTVLNSARAHPVLGGPVCLLFFSFLPKKWTAKQQKAKGKMMGKDTKSDRIYTKLPFQKRHSLGIATQPLPPRGRPEKQVSQEIGAMEDGPFS